ncbi:MAG: type II toxin-antitoxin system VapC family toxin [Dongiaceae bacterium]
MKITVDTNVLVRAIVEDDEAQAKAAQAILDKASLIAVPVPVLCELAWVLRRGYRKSTADIADAIEALLEVEALVTDIPAAEAGLAMLRSGGDFADGVIAQQGHALGGTAFVSFDREAVARWQAQGGTAIEPA